MSGGGVRVSTGVPGNVCGVRGVQERQAPEWDVYSQSACV